MTPYSLPSPSIFSRRSRLLSSSPTFPSLASMSLPGCPSLPDILLSDKYLPCVAILNLTELVQIIKSKQIYFTLVAGQGWHNPSPIYSVDNLWCLHENETLYLPLSSYWSSQKDNIMCCKYQLMGLSAMVGEGTEHFSESLEQQRKMFKTVHWGSSLAVQ